MSILQRRRRLLFDLPRGLPTTTEEGADVGPPAPSPGWREERERREDGVLPPGEGGDDCATKKE
jgi:hypothetical protein